MEDDLLKLALEIIDLFPFALASQKFRTPDQFSL